jgi:hypothetical protein
LRVKHNRLRVSIPAKYNIVCVARYSYIVAMTKTSIVIGDRAASPSDKGMDTLVVPGEVADLRIHNVALSLRASKLLHLLVRGAGADACRRMRHSVRELALTAVELRYVNEAGRRVVKIGPMLADLERDLDDHGPDAPALVTWEFSPVMLVLLSTSDHWAALSRKAVMAFEGRYSLRLYELVSLRGGRQFHRKERFDLDDLRRRLGVEPGKLPAFANFKQRCLDPAVAEVNQLSGLKVKYAVVKTGRKVTGIELSWGEVPAAGRAVQVRELENSRVGRKARRDGMAEEVAPAEAVSTPEIIFPRFGSIRLTAFEGIARASLPAGHRSLDQIQKDFVQFADAKGIPLKGGKVVAVFADFCAKQEVDLASSVRPDA